MIPTVCPLKWSSEMCIRDRLTDEFRNADHASQDALVSAVQQMERALGGSGKVSFKKLGAEVTAYPVSYTHLSTVPGGR